MNIINTLYREMFKFDIAVQDWVIHNRHDGFDFFFVNISQLGSSLALVSLGIFLAIIMVLKNKKLQALFLNSGLVTAWAIMHYSKLFFGRERPGGEHLVIAYGYSFPSGHSMIALVFYGFLAYLFYEHLPSRTGRALVCITALFIVFIGISRIYLNVHYFSDVVGGFLFGGVLLLLLIKIYQKTNEIKHSRN